MKSLVFFEIILIAWHIYISKWKLQIVIKDEDERSFFQRALDTSCSSE